MPFFRQADESYANESYANESSAMSSMQMSRRRSPFTAPVRSTGDDMILMENSLLPPPPPPHPPHAPVWNMQMSRGHPLLLLLSFIWRSSTTLIQRINRWIIQHRVNYSTDEIGTRWANNLQVKSSIQFQINWLFKRHLMATGTGRMEPTNRNERKWINKFEWSDGVGSRQRRFSCFHRNAVGEFICISRHVTALAAHVVAAISIGL